MIRASVKFVRESAKLAEKIKNELEKAKTANVVVGIVREAQYDDGTPVGIVGFWNEFGTENIPARPFFRPAVAESRQRHKEIVTQEMNAITQGKQTTVNALKRLGVLYSEAIKKKIQSNVPPPNAPSTLKGKVGTKTLIDSRLLLRSIGYEVKEK